jgi:hypothetical protein
LPADASFWRAAEGRLAVERGDGVRPLRGPGLLLGWRRRTGETWLVNARADHPDDIPGHDYTPYYGKSLIRSHFALTVRTAAGHPGPDGAVLFVGKGQPDHRGLTEAGDVGPGWAWSRYRVAGDGGQHDVTMVVLPWHDLEIRLTAVRPASPVRLVEAPAALGTDSSAGVRRMVSDDGRLSAAWTDTRSVAIRSLLGYDLAVESAPWGTGPDANLVAEHAEQPAVAESVPSARPRVVASVGWAGADRTVPIADLETVTAVLVAPEIVQVRLGSEELAMVDLGRRPGRAPAVDGVRACGRAVRVLRTSIDRSSVGGEAIDSIDGVIRLDRPGPISLRRSPDALDIWAEGGFSVDPQWTGFAARAIQVREIDERWSTPLPLDSANVVPTTLVRRLRRSTGRRLLELRLRP